MTKMTSNRYSPEVRERAVRLHKTMLHEFYHLAFRKKIYRSIEDLQRDLDAWLAEYNEVRSHQGRWCHGKAPMQTFRDALPLAQQKVLQAQ